MKSYKATYKPIKRMEVSEKFTKVEQILKLQSGKTSTVPIIEGNESEDDTPCPPTPRRSVQSQDKKYRQSERSSEWRKNMLVAWPQALYRKVKSTIRIIRQVCEASTTK